MGKKKLVRVKASISKKSEEPDELPAFEQSLEDLEKVVAELESGHLSLSESLGRYELGIQKLKECHFILENAENRIRLLTGVQEDGTIQTQEFDDQETRLGERSAKRSFREQGPTPEREFGGQSGHEESEEDGSESHGSLF